MPAADKKTARKAGGLSDEERDALKARLQEEKADGADGEALVLAKIAEMPEPDRALGERLHAIIRAAVPALVPRLWYGMPAYARDGKMICFFQCAQKFKTRYAELGFSDKAHLDDDTMWPVAYAVMELTPAAEARISALVKQAAS